VADLKLLDQLKISGDQREDAPGKARPPLVIASVLVLLAVAGAAAWYFLRDRGVEVESVDALPAREQGAQAAVLQATGYVTARRQATVSAQITGTVADVLIEEGERVAAGQVLAHLNDTALRAGLAQAEAGLNAARANLVQVKSQLAQAQRDQQRARDLGARQLIATQAVESAQTQADVLAAQADAQQRQVELAEAGVQAARVQLGYATVRAPFAGVVTARSAQVGEIVSPLSAGGGFTRTGIGTIVDMASLEVEVDVNESYINRVTPKQPGMAVLDAYPGWNIPVHVIAIIPTADRGKATVKVRLGLDVRDPRILPEMGVRVNFLDAAPAATAKGAVAPPAPGGVLVPPSAVVERAGQPGVFSIDAGRAHLLPVKVGATMGELQLVEGVPVGTTLVREPPEALQEGARVRPKAAAQ
jgi:RND family efflux transporter MFP subunit